MTTKTIFEWKVEISLGLGPVSGFGSLISPASRPCKKKCRLLIVLVN